MTVVTVVPLLPGLANAVSPDEISIDAGFQHLHTFNWLYCFILALTLYFSLNKFFPHKPTLIPEMVPGTNDHQDADRRSSVLDVEMKGEYSGED